MIRIGGGFPQPLAIALIVIGAIAIIAGIAFAVARAAKAKGNSEIKVEHNLVYGKGYVGAIGKDAYDLEGGVTPGNFSLSYEQITSVNASGQWLVIIAAGSQYSLKMTNAQAVANEIQKNMNRARIT